MKDNRETVLDVDFIGNQDRPLTEKESEAISKFIKANKLKRKSTLTRQKNKKKEKESA